MTEQSLSGDKVNDLMPLVRSPLFSHTFRISTSQADACCCPGGLDSLLPLERWKGHPVGRGDMPT
jgi:hypothetical protein